MAVGTLAALIVVMRMRAAERHVKFQLVLALCLAGGAAALYLPGLGDEYRAEFPRGQAAFTSLDGALPWTLVLLGALALVVNVLYGTFRRTAARAMLVVATAFGALVAY